MSNLDDYLKPVIKMPETLARLLKEQTTTLQSSIRVVNNSSEIQELGNKIDTLAHGLHSLPKPPKAKSAWLPMFVMAFLALLMGSTAMLGFMVWQRSENDQTFADRVKNERLTTNNCKALGFNVAPQKNGTVYCMKLIPSAKQ